MTSKHDSHMRIMIGLAITAFGAMAIYGMIEMGSYARWEQATMHDIASFAFSCGVAVIMLVGGVLLIINPKIRGAKIW